MRRILKKLVLFFVTRLDRNAARNEKIIGWNNTLVHLFFQRVLRINASSPWPVHWSSRVVHPERIVKKSYRPFPGYMPGQYIQAVNGIHIGNGVRIGPGAKVISANHNVLDYDLHDDAEPIEFGDNCWIGANAVILPAVKLGEHVIVAAGAVVTRSWLENDIVLAGIPAKIVKRLEPYTGAVGYGNEGLDPE